MERIASFSINHDTLEPGLYTSRIDGDVVTYDLRMVYPNQDVYLDNDEMHTFEHLFATYARNSGAKDSILYVGPMGCRTGFYVLVRDSLTSESVIRLVQETLEFIAGYQGEIPGSAPEECGNAAEHNLEKATKLARRMTKILESWDVEKLRYRD